MTRTFLPLLAVLAACGPNDPLMETLPDADLIPLDSGPDSGPDAVLTAQDAIDARERLDAGAGADTVLPPSPIAVRLAAPWNGAVVASGRPVFRTQPASTSVELQVCIDINCTEIVTTLRGVSPLRPELPLSAGRYFARTRVETGGEFSPTFAFVVNRSEGGDAMWLGYNDFDGDGYEDALVVVDVGTVESTTVVYGGPADEPARLWSVPVGREPGGNPRLDAIGDLNGDGYSDLVLVAGVPEVYLGSRDGLPSTPVAVRLEAETGAGLACIPCSGSVVGDVNGDGYTDLGLFGGDSLAGGRTVAYWVSGGSDGLQGTATAFGEERAWANGGYDLDGDGMADLVSASQIDFGGPSGLGMSRSVAGSPYIRVAGDSDGDGEIDLLAQLGSIGPYGETFGYYETEADGLRALPSTDLGRHFDLVGGRDLNGDGSTDHLMAPLGQAGVIISWGRSTTIISTEFLAFGISLADLDADGFVDLVIEAGIGGQLHMFRVPGTASGPDFSLASEIARPDRM